jgi:putative transcriptional regulator
MNNYFAIKGNNAAPTSGSILVSEPLLQDSYFGRSVVLLIEHSQNEGSVGVILNKPLDLSFNQVVKSSPTLNAGMFLGGPVEVGNIYFLHTLGHEIENSIEVIKGLYWGGNISQVNELISLQVIQPNNIRFFVGYSGWNPLQLEEELNKNNWAIVQASSDEIWKQPTSHLWNTMVAKLGNSFKFWDKLPLNPQDN